MRRPSFSQQNAKAIVLDRRRTIECGFPEQRCGPP
jgi:hypothetical protein